MHWHTPPPQFSPAAHVVPLQEQTPPAPQLPPWPHSLFTEQPQYFCARLPRSQSRVPLQSLPQPPQFRSSCRTFSSQPLSAPGAAGMLQFAKPISHVESQTPPAQLFEATFVPAHARPHAPQWVTSASVFVSQPSSAAGAAGVMQSP